MYIYFFRVQSLCTAVIQLYTCGPNENRWVKKVTGVVCLVKDSNRRSYYIQVFDMDIPQRIWEQELYNEIDYKCLKHNVHVFEADQSMAALYFAEITEAQDFFQQVPKYFVFLRFVIFLKIICFLRCKRKFIK